MLSDYKRKVLERDELSLNAPYGARCFLTPPGPLRHDGPLRPVLMHLMALGAF